MRFFSSLLSIPVLLGLIIGECAGKNIKLMFKSLANFLVILDLWAE